MFYIDHFSRVPHGDIWDSAYGYAQEVGDILYHLARRPHANVVLVGQEGVGSFGIAKEAASRMKTHPDLKNSRVLFVGIQEILASIPSGIGQLHAISKTVSEIERVGDTVVILLGMKNVFAGKYAVSAEDVLHPFFASSSVRTITMLSDEEYHEHVVPNKELANLATMVPVAGLSVDTTKKFLKKIFDLKVPHEVLDEVVEKTEGLFSHIPYPKRAIDVIHELIENNTLSKERVHHHISKKTGVDLHRLKDAHTLNLEEVLGHHIVGQGQAIAEIANAMVRARNASTDSKRPLASMLFVGEEGSGKTETANVIAKTYFGSSERIVRLNAERLAEDLPSAITEHPHSVLLIDGLEKASDAASGILQAVLNDGYISDRFDRKYFTTHMIIIALSNIQGVGLYDEELLASFDGVIEFNELKDEHTHEIARHMLARFNGRLQIEHDVSLEITPELVEYAAHAGTSAVEHAALQAISKGKVVPGGKILIDPMQLQEHFR